MFVVKGAPFFPFGCSISRLSFQSPFSVFRGINDCIHQLQLLLRGTV